MDYKVDHCLSLAVTCYSLGAKRGRMVFEVFSILCLNYFFHIEAASLGDTGICFALELADAQLRWLW